MEKIEKRRHRRKKNISPTYLSSPIGLRKTYSRDISRGGMLIRTVARIVPGTKMTLLYSVDGNNKVSEGVAVRTGEDGIGVRFR